MYIYICIYIYIYLSIYITRLCGPIVGVPVSEGRRVVVTEDLEVGAVGERLSHQPPVVGVRRTSDAQVGHVRV